MKIAITGGGGFIGRKLALRLAERERLHGQAITGLLLADLAAPAPVEAAFPVETVAADISSPAGAAAAIPPGTGVVYHLAAVVSGHAEADFEAGMAANFHGTLNVLERCRSLGTAPLVVYTSSIAVYGGEVPDPIEDWYLLNPQTSYGTQKAVGELLLNDYSRRGFIDGRGLRLPTISIRPGRPNRAASSFMSSIFREPLQGREAVCPVGPDYAHWYLSPRRVIDNLIHSAGIDAADMGQNRCFALPGRTYTIGEMVEAMRAVAGDGPCNLIRWEDDPETRKIVVGWRARFNPRKALKLGFQRDESFADNIRYFLEDDLET
ncbi:MAG: D-erythronate dehydrogenase [Paracoccaceae bacterium]